MPRLLSSRLRVLVLVTAAHLPALAQTASAPPPAASSTVSPQQAASADENALIQRGVQLRRERRDAEALGEFQKAFSLSGSPRAQAQLALAQQALGHWVDAERNLVEALQKHDAWLDRNQSILLASLSSIREHLGKLRIHCDTPMTSLLIDQQQRVLPPRRELTVPVGWVKVEIAAPGFITDKRSVLVEPGEEVELTCKLVSIRGVAESPRNRGMLEQPRAGNRAARATASVDRASDPPRTLFWVLAASAGILLSEALVAELAREHYAAEYNDDSACVYGELTRRERCGKYRDRAMLAETLAIAGFISGGAAALGSALLHATAASHAVVSPGSSQIRLGYSGRF